MASFYDFNPDQQRQPGAAAGVPTFSQLQQRGMPRPPPAPMAAPSPYHSPIDIFNRGQPQLPAGPQPQMPPPGVGGGYTPWGGQQPVERGMAKPPGPGRPTGQSFPGVDVGHPSGPGFPNPNDPGNPGGGTQPPGAQPPLNQSTLEAYLYQMLTDPTSTQPYQNSMRRIQSAADVDASRRGVFNSTIPGAATAEAGSNLAAQMQQQAFGNLQSYNTNYEQLLSMLLGLGGGGGSNG